MVEQVLSNEELALEYAPVKWGQWYPDLTGKPVAEWPAIFKSWLEEKKAGRDRGSPVGPEQHLRSGGVMQVFERGDCLWKNGKTSWSG